MSVSVDQIVAASGLSPLFARSAIQRAIDRCGVTLDRLTRNDSERLVEDLRRVIGIFDPEHVESACGRIKRLLDAS